MLCRVSLKWLCVLHSSSKDNDSSQAKMIKEKVLNLEQSVKHPRTPLANPGGISEDTYVEKDI